MTAGYSERGTAPQSSGLAPLFPFKFKVLDRIVMALQRMGFIVGAMHLLGIPARQSGIVRSTSLPLLTIGGQRYIVAADDDAAWVLDARAAGRGILRRGRVDEHVCLIELPVAQRAPVLRELPRSLPAAVPALRRRYRVAADPEAFAALAPRCPVFRVERC
jgi:hypothetical protein